MDNLYQYLRRWASLRISNITRTNNRPVNRNKIPEVTPASVQFTLIFVDEFPAVGIILMELEVVEFSGNPIKLPFISR